MSLKEIDNNLNNVIVTTNGVIIDNSPGSDSLKEVARQIEASAAERAKEEEQQQRKALELKRNVDKQETRSSQEKKYAEIGTRNKIEHELLQSLDAHPLARGQVPKTTLGYFADHPEIMQHLQGKSSQDIGEALLAHSQPAVLKTLAEHPLLAQQTVPAALRHPQQFAQVGGTLVPAPFTKQMKDQGVLDKLFNTFIPARKTPTPDERSLKSFLDWGKKALGVGMKQPQIFKPALDIMPKLGTHPDFKHPQQVFATMMNPLTDKWAKKQAPEAQAVELQTLVESATAQDMFVKGKTLGQITTNKATRDSYLQSDPRFQGAFKELLAEKLLARDPEGALGKAALEQANIFFSKKASARSDVQKTRSLVEAYTPQKVGELIQKVALKVRRGDGVSVESGALALRVGGGAQPSASKGAKLSTSASVLGNQVSSSLIEQREFEHKFTEAQKLMNFVRDGQLDSRRYGKVANLLSEMLKPYISQSTVDLYRQLLQKASEQDSTSAAEPEALPESQTTQTPEALKLKALQRIFQGMAARRAGKTETTATKSPSELPAADLQTVAAELFPSEQGELAKLSPKARTNFLNNLVKQAPFTALLLTKAKGGNIQDLRGMPAYKQQAFTTLKQKAESLHAQFLKIKADFSKAKSLERTLTELPHNRWSAKQEPYIKAENLLTGKATAADLATSLKDLKTSTTESRGAAALGSEAVKERPAAHLGSRKAVSGSLSKGTTEQQAVRELKNLVQKLGGAEGFVKALTKVFSGTEGLSESGALSMGQAALGETWAHNVAEMPPSAEGGEQLFTPASTATSATRLANQFISADGRVRRQSSELRLGGGLAITNKQRKQPLSERELDIGETEPGLIDAESSQEDEELLTSRRPRGPVIAKPSAGKVRSPQEIFAAPRWKETDKPGEGLSLKEQVPLRNLGWDTAQAWEAKWSKGAVWPESMHTPFESLSNKWKQAARELGLGDKRLWNNFIVALQQKKALIDR